MISALLSLAFGIGGFVVFHFALRRPLGSRANRRRGHVDRSLGGGPQDQSRRQRRGRPIK